MAGQSGRQDQEPSFMGAHKRRNVMKKGYKTTEFWTSLFAQLAGLAVLTGVIDVEAADALGSAASQLAGAVIAGAGAVGYAYSRGKAKGTV
jgi:hypothetical protein